VGFVHRDVEGTVVLRLAEPAKRWSLFNGEI
jgi:hypothetical protein